MKICNWTIANVKPFSLFNHFTGDCKPIATKSRKFSSEDYKFIQTEIQRLLKENIREPSNSPWRAQVLVTSNSNHKKRIVVDYSITINKFTLLYAYPLPNIESLVNQISQYEYFSSIDLRSAYHKIPILENEQLYTNRCLLSTHYQQHYPEWGIDWHLCILRWCHNL